MHWCKTIVGLPGWLGSTLKDWACPRSRSAGEAAVHQFAHMLGVLRSPGEVRAALVYLAHQISGALLVELELEDPSGHTPRPVACWPHPPVSTRQDEPLALELPLQFEGKLRGTLRLMSDGRAWSKPVLHRLETLCALAAAAELRSARSDDDEATRDTRTGTYNTAYFSAFLTHALARARRRHEPVTVFAIALDELPALRERCGLEVAEAALSRAARAVLKTLRGSDVVARLDTERLVAVLPGCKAVDGVRVAEAVRAAVGEAALVSALAALPTVSLGVAAAPDHACEAGPLLAAAVDALARAQALGTGHVTLAPPVRAVPSQMYLHRVG